LKKKNAVVVDVVVDVAEHNFGRTLGGINPSAFCWPNCNLISGGKNDDDPNDGKIRTDTSSEFCLRPSIQRGIHLLSVTSL